MTGKQHTVYALYKGNEFLFLGTVNEIAKQMNVSPGTIFYYQTPTAKKRKSKLVLIKVDDD